MRILSALLPRSSNIVHCFLVIVCNILCLLVIQRSGAAFVRSSPTSAFRRPFSSIFASVMSTATTSKADTRDGSPLPREFSNYTDSLQFYHALRSCKDQYISSHLNKALDSLSDALRLYGPNHVFSSYNGGKDADVIMHLLRAVFAKYSDERGVNVSPEMVYFYNPDEFEEVTEHIERSKTLYNLNITTYDNGIVEGLKQHLLLRGDNAHCAFVLGTRKGDPNCGEQEVFAPASAWMPIPFMRVNPILHWEYGHVWHFLRTFNLSYCSLYDQGYTSLGKKSQTFPNPALQRKNPAPPVAKVVDDASIARTTTSAEYWPAYMLSDWTLERSGRASSVSLKPKNFKSEEEIAREQEESQVDSEGNVLVHACSAAGAASSASSKSPSVPTQTAALLIIGDEILNGFTSDSNLQVTSKALVDIGIPLKKVSIVSDDVDDIAQEVQRLSQRYDIVFTSGGIGPTHDDVTLKAIAKALRQDIRINAEMLQHLETVHIEQQRRKQLDAVPASSTSNNEERPIPPMEDSMRRLAFLPEQSQLRFPPPPDDYYVVSQGGSGGAHDDPPPLRNKTWPILQCDNIFVLPGVPQFYAAKVALITKHFLSKQRVHERWKIILDVEERGLVTHLDAVVAAHPKVKIGSYPYVEHPEFKTIITVEAPQAAQVEAAVQAVVEALPRHAVLRVERVATSSMSGAADASK